MKAQTITLDNVPTPEVALIVYSDGQVSRHPVVTQYQKCAIGAGNLLSDDGLKALFTPYSDQFAHRNEQSQRQFLPSSVFCRSDHCLGWTVSSRRAPMWFSDLAPIPAVLWCSLLFFAENINGVSLKVFALKDSCVTPETRLFHAPLMNIDASGYLCFGNATNPAKTTLEAMPVFEQAVYDTKFSHVNHTQTLLADGAVSNNAHYKFWKSLSGENEFPLDRLNPTNLTVADLISGV